MSALDTSIANLTTAVTENTTAANGIIAALAAQEPTAEQLAAIDAQTTAVQATTKSLNDAVTPPAATPPAS